MNMNTAIECIPENPAVRRVWIIAQLRLKGTSLRRLALKEGVTPQAMSLALISASSHLQAVIADAVGLPVHKLFREFYDASGNRLGWTRDPQRTTGAPGSNVKTDGTLVRNERTA
jgi:lambda repressor-like predicted transcriptional regulator